MKPCAECRECWALIQEYILDRVVPMGLDALRFQRQEREIEKWLEWKRKKISGEVPESKEERNGL